MRNLIVEEEVARKREAFISSIDRHAICELASSYHHDDDKGKGKGANCCKIFGMKHGSFNVCFFVEFARPEDGGKPDRWVVRIPFPARVPWIDEKVDSEVATMKYVRKNTTIPVPEVIAYSYTAGSPIGLAFIITEYIEGTTLRSLGFHTGRRWQTTKAQAQAQAQDDSNSNSTHHNSSSSLAYVYDQLADVYIQLRSLEFSEIGALGMPTGTGADDDNGEEGITIRHRPLPVEALLQHAEGIDTAQSFPEKKTFQTACEYVAALVRLAWNLFMKTRNPDIGPEKQDAMGDLYAYLGFCEYVSGRWITKRGNSGPFVLAHGDMDLHDGNLIWDSNTLKLRAVIDWEWSCTVPVQCFIPPTWLNGFHPRPIPYLVGHGKAAYESALATFCAHVAARSAEISPRSSSPLASEWESILVSSRHSVVLALRYPDTIIDVYWDLVDHKIYPLRSLEDVIRYPERKNERLEQFSKRERIAELLQRKLSEQEAFDAEYRSRVEKQGGELRFCRCEWCREEEGRFEGLRELPFYSFQDDISEDGRADGSSSST